MAGFAYVAAEDATRIKFEAMADDAINRIESRIDLHVSLLRSTHAMFVSQSADVSRRRVQGISSRRSMSPRISTACAGSASWGWPTPARTRASSARLTELQGAPKPIFPTASDGDWRTPVLLFELNDGGDTKGIGYDMFSDPLRRDAILAALETGEPRATGRVELGAPVGRRGEARASCCSRASKRSQSGDGTPAGFLYASFSAQDLFKAALEKFPLLPVNAEVFHGEPTLSNRLFASKEPAVASGGDLVATRQMLVAGVPWTIQFHPTAHFSRPSSRAIPILLGLFGLLLAVAIALVARYQGRAYDAMSQLTRLPKQACSEKDLMLQEMKHRIKNSISRVLAIARQTAANGRGHRRVLDILFRAPAGDGRLAGHADPVTLAEGRSWRAAADRACPGVRKGTARRHARSVRGYCFRRAMTQALGLTFHELATNALKYGEVGNSTETLKVDWKVLRNGREKRLVLHWREASSTPIAVPEKTGFGTKLIDMNITRELGGTIERGYRDDGLEIEISIPLRGEA